jgi:hypothetical protein
MPERNRRDDAPMGALVRFWPLLAALFAAGSASGVAIYKSNAGLASLAEYKAEQIVRDRAQWTRIGDVDDKVDAMRERMATVEAHHR